MLDKGTNLRKFARLMFDKLQDSIKNNQNNRKGYARNFNIERLDSRDPTIQLNDTKSYIKNKFKTLLEEMRGFKFQ